MPSGDLLKATIDLDAVRARLQNRHERAFRLLRDAQRLILAPHPDADGLSAAALLVSGFRILDRRWTLMPINTPSRSFTREDLEELRRTKPDIICYLDLSPGNLEQVDELKKMASLVVVDHHRPNPELLERMLLGVNPEPDIHSSAGGYPTAKLVYDLLGAGARADLALVGVVGDRTTESWRTFTKQFSEEEITLAQRVALRLSLIGPATRIDIREPRAQVVKRQRSLFSYLAHAKTLAAFMTSVEATRPLKDTFEQLEEGIAASAGKAQIAIESGVEFVHVPIKPTTPWSVISGVLSRLELVAPGQTIVLTEPQYRGVEMRVMTNDPDVDVIELLKGFGGGHANLGGGHADARASEVVDVLRERWSAQKRTE